MAEPKPTRRVSVPYIPPRDAARPQPSSGTFRLAAVRRILELPAPVLRVRAFEVDPRSPEVVDLADTLVTTMRAWADCTGLSAPQIGELARLVCVDVSRRPDARTCSGLVVLANPRILGRADPVLVRDGCLSVPELEGYVVRAASVVVEGLEPGSGRRVQLTAEGIEAFALQHEIDHLDGVLFPERVDDPARNLFGRGGG